MAERPQLSGLLGARPNPTFFLFCDMNGTMQACDANHFLHTLHELIRHCVIRRSMRMGGRALRTPSP